MAVQHSVADEPFFREWRSREPTGRRSLARAARLRAALGLDEITAPVLTVVGSKGKGTIALYASAALSAGGLKVGTLTSPSMISNRERIRIGGTAISASEYSNLSNRLDRALSILPKPDTTEYLSPTGLFTTIAVRHFVDCHCDALVLEAGMGGRSDEVSLYPPLIVAIGAIFAEHIGILGKNVSEIAADKAGVASEQTRCVLSVPQSFEVTEVLSRVLGSRLLFPLSETAAADTLKDLPFPSGLSELNAKLGVLSAFRLLQQKNLAFPAHKVLRSVLSTVRHPGRLSVHAVGDATWVVDAPVDERGLSAALDWCERNIKKPDIVFVSFPDSKDVAGAQRALSGYDYVPVCVQAPHLEYSDELWRKKTIHVRDIKKHANGSCVLLVGTMSFVAEVLQSIDVDFETLYSRPDGNH